MYEGERVKRWDEDSDGELAAAIALSIAESGDVEGKIFYLWFLSRDDFRGGKKGE